jgi:hypothetical protein
LKESFMHKRLLGVILAAVVVASIGLGLHTAQPVSATVVAPNWGSYYRTDLAPYSAACSTGAGTDVSAAVNAAIADASGFGRGTVIVPPCQTTVGNEPWGSPTGEFYGISSSIVPQPYVELDMRGAYFKWIGTNSSTKWMVQHIMPSGTPLQGFDTFGGEFDAAANNLVNGVQLDSWSNSSSTDLTVRSANAPLQNGTNIGFELSSVNNVGWINNDAMDGIFHIKIGSFNIGIELDAGVTDLSFHGVDMEQIGRTAFETRNATDNVRFYDFQVGCSNAPNDGSYWTGIKLGTVAGQITNDYYFDGGSITNCQTDHSDAINFATPGCCGGLEIKNLYLGGFTFGTFIRNPGNAASYSIEIANDGSIGGAQTMKTYTKGKTTPGALLPGGYAKVTTAQSGITTEAALTGMSMTVIGYGEPVRVAWHFLVSGSHTGDYALVQLKEGSTIYAQNYMLITTGSGAYSTSDSSILLSPLATGSHVLILTLTRSSGTGTVAMFANSTSTPAILTATAS